MLGKSLQRKPLCRDLSRGFFLNIFEKMRQQLDYEIVKNISFLLKNVANFKLTTW